MGWEVWIPPSPPLHLPTSSRWWSFARFGPGLVYLRIDLSVLSLPCGSIGFRSIAKAQTLEERCGFRRIWRKPEARRRRIGDRMCMTEHVFSLPLAS